MASGQLSGQPVTLLSGRSFIASGHNVVAESSVQSGEVYLASGRHLFWSGELYPASGAFVRVPIDTISGVVPNVLSGQVQPASGAFVRVPIDTISGTNVTATATVGSGLFVTVPPSSISGVFANVPRETLSGVIANSGLFANIPSETLSGVNVIADKFGYFLANIGLDLIQVESGLNFRQAQAIIAAAAAGKLSGAGTNTIRIDGAGVPGTQRILATVMESGNRLVVNLNPPA